MSRQPILRRASLVTASLAGILLASCGESAEPISSSKVANESTDAAVTPASNPAPAKPAPKKGKGKGKGNRVDPAEFGKITAPVSQPAPEGIELPPNDPILGPVLVIEGQIIPHDVIRREVCRGPAGNSAAELEKLSMIMTQEINRRVEQGASPSDFVITDDEIQATIEMNAEALKEQFPEGEIEMRHLLPAGVHGVADQVHLTELFMKVFLPPGPADELPPITITALQQADQGKQLLEALRTEREAEAEGEDLSGNSMFRQIIIQTLREYLVSSSDIDDGDDLPVDVLMRVNGQDMLTATIWNRVKDFVSDVEVRQAKQWLANMKLLEAEMGSNWLTLAEADAKFEEYAAPYRESMFSVENVALMVKRYPNVSAFRKFRRAYDSYQQKIADELNPEDLRRFAEARTKQLIGQAVVDVDVILLSAYDFHEKQWIEDGWEKAAERADEVFRQLVEEKVPWDEVLERFSDFYDIPTGKDFVAQQLPAKSKGRFRALTRNTLMQQLQESEYLQFLNGQTIADYIFFGLKEGNVSAPIRGPHGYYICRLLRKQPAPQKVDLEDEQLIVMAEQDYTLLNLAEYCLELRNEKQVYGIE